MSSARLCPISRGSRTVPPSISGTPQRRQKTPKTASVAATRRSHHRASSSPPATANPSTAAITGLSSSIRGGPMGPGPERSSSIWLPLPAAIAARSAPEQNVPPAPVSTATVSSSSASKSRNADSSASAVARSTALRVRGRSIVTTRVRSCTAVVIIGSLRGLVGTPSSVEDDAGGSGGGPMAPSSTGGRSVQLVQPEPDLQGDLEVLDLAVVEVAADVGGLEPVEVAQGLRRPLDRRA